MPGREPRPQQTSPGAPAGCRHPVADLEVRVRQHPGGRHHGGPGPLPRLPGALRAQQRQVRPATPPPPPPWATLSSHWGRHHSSTAGMSAGKRRRPDCQQSDTVLAVTVCFSGCRLPVLGCALARRLLAESASSQSRAGALQDQIHLADR